MRFMDERREIRINHDILKEVSLVTNKNPEVYNNVSHFIRVAIMRELRRKFKQKNY